MEPFLSYFATSVREDFLLSPFLNPPTSASLSSMTALKTAAVVGLLKSIEASICNSGYRVKDSQVFGSKWSRAPFVMKPVFTAWSLVSTSETAHIHLDPTCTGSLINPQCIRRGSHCRSANATSSTPCCVWELSPRRRSRTEGKQWNSEAAPSLE